MENEKYLYALAELDNLRKRTAKDIASTREEVKRDTLLLLLPIVDDLERCVTALQNGADADATRAGILAIAGKARQTLASMDVEAIESVGKPFAAELMEAIAKVATKSLPPNHVSMEVQRGYRIGGDLLRPAQVAVTEEE